MLYMLYMYKFFIIYLCDVKGQGCTKKLFEGGVWNFFVWKEIVGIFFFLKIPTKQIEENFYREGILTP